MAILFFMIRFLNQIMLYGHQKLFNISTTVNIILYLLVFVIIGYLKLENNGNLILCLENH